MRRGAGTRVGAAVGEVVGAVVGAVGAPGRLLAGPIFQREVIGAGRRRGPYLLRFLYAIVLLLVVSLAFAGSWSGASGGRSGVAMAQSLQQIAPIVTSTIGWFTLIAMALVGPALTGGAIADEKRARTLPTLMTTPMSSLHIVIGKLTSRIVQFVILALLAAPLLLAVRLFGGVPAMTIVATMVIALSTALLGAALGLMYSIWHTRGTTAMLFAIVTMALVMVGPILVWMVVTDFSAPPGDLIMSTCAPAALFAVQEPAAFGFLGVITVPLGALTVTVPVWAANALYSVALAALATGVATVALRRVMLAEASGGTGAGGLLADALRLIRRRQRTVRTLAILAVGALAGGAWLLSAGAFGAVAGVTVALALVVVMLIGAALATGLWLLLRTTNRSEMVESGLRTRGSERRSREVGDAPVLWRELRQVSLGSRRKLIGAMLVAYGGPAFLWIRYGPGEEGVHWPIAIICVGGAMLQAALMTTGAVGAEREAGSWDTLLTTPLRPRQILGGKFLGTLRRQWLLLSVLVGNFGLAAIGGWAPPILLLHIIIIVAGPIVLLSGSGLLMSMLFKRTTVAAIWNLGAAIVLWLATWLMIGMIAWVLPGGNRLAELLAQLNLMNFPPAMLGFALEGGLSQWGPRDGTYEVVDWTVTTAGFTAIAAAASAAQILAGLAMVYFATTRFNRLTGRSS